jgi:hypothetical protein
MRKTIFVTAVLVLGLAGSAQAQDTTISASLNPATPAAGSTLHVAFSGTAPELGGTLPEAIGIGVQRGFVIDLAAVARRCPASAATTGNCPAASRIGGGTALVHTSGLFTADLTATMDLYLGERAAAGDLASVILRVTVGTVTRGVSARLQALPSGPFGYQLVATGFASAVPSFPGVNIELRSLTFDLGAARNVRTTVIKRKRVTRNGKRVTIKRKVKKTVRHNLIKTPKTCSGTWSARVVVRVAGTNRTRDLAVPCTAA